MNEFKVGDYIYLEVDGSYEISPAYEIIEMRDILSKSGSVFTMYKIKNPRSNKIRFIEAGWTAAADELGVLETMSGVYHDPPIEYLKLGDRVNKSLRYLGVETLDDLLSYTPDEVRLFPGLGKKSFLMVEDSLRNLSRTLGLFRRKYYSDREID